MESIPTYYMYTHYFAVSTLPQCGTRRWSQFDIRFARQDRVTHFCANPLGYFPPNRPTALYSASEWSALESEGVVPLCGISYPGRYEI